MNLETPPAVFLAEDEYYSFSTTLLNLRNLLESKKSYKLS